MTKPSRQIAEFAKPGAHAFLPASANAARSRVAAAAIVAGFAIFAATGAAEAHWSGGSHGSSSSSSSSNSSSQRTWTPPARNVIIVQPQQQQQYQQPAQQQTTQCPQIGSAYPTYGYGCPPVRPVVPNQYNGAAYGQLQHPVNDVGHADRQLVDAAVRAASLAGVDPTVLLSFHDRSRAAERMMHSRVGMANAAAPIAGPYAFTTQRWLGAVKRNAGALSYASAGPAAAGSSNVANLAAAIDRDASGRFVVQDQASLPAVMTARSSPIDASAVAAADLAANIALFRERMNAAPHLADLYVGHHGGAGMMLHIAEALRQNPNTPLSGVLPPEQARDLLILSGLPGSAQNGRSLSVGAFYGSLDAALRTSKVAYSAVVRSPSAAPTTAPYAPLQGGAGLVPDEVIEPAPGPR